MLTRDEGAHTRVLRSGRCCMPRDPGPTDDEMRRTCLVYQRVLWVR